MLHLTLVIGTNVSPIKLLAVLFFLAFFLFWMYIKAKMDDEDKKEMKKHGKRRRLHRNINLMKARIVRKIKKGDDE